MLGKRIHEHTVLLQAVMQVGSCGKTCRADASDRLTLTDRHAGFDAGRERRQMQIVRLVSRRMSNPHHPSIRPVERRGNDPASSDRHHRRAGRRCVVHASVRARPVQHRMHPPG